MLRLLFSFVPFVAATDFNLGRYIMQGLLVALLGFCCYCLLIGVSSWLLLRPFLLPTKPRRLGRVVLLNGLALALDWCLDHSPYSRYESPWQYPPLVLLGLALTTALSERLWPSAKR